MSKMNAAINLSFLYCQMITGPCELGILSWGRENEKLHSRKRERESVCVCVSQWSRVNQCQITGDTAPSPGKFLLSLSFSLSLTHTHTNTVPLNGIGQQPTQQWTWGETTTTTATTNFYALLFKRRWRGGIRPNDYSGAGAALLLTSATLY